MTASRSQRIEINIQNYNARVVISPQTPLPGLGVPKFLEVSTENNPVYKDIIHKLCMNIFNLQTASASVSKHFLFFSSGFVIRPFIFCGARWP
jgi:hypothetical protein